MRVYDAQTKGTTYAQVCAHVCAERECEEFGRHPWKVAMGVRVHTDGSMSTMSTMSTMCVLPMVRHCSTSVFHISCSTPTCQLTHRANAANDTPLLTTRRTSHRSSDPHLT